MILLQEYVRSLKNIFTTSVRKFTKKVQQINNKKYIIIMILQRDFASF
jgi:hypothetical protein